MRGIGCGPFGAAGRICIASVIAGYSSAAAFAQDKPTERPRVIAVAPITVSPGTTVNLKIRGAKLSNATELRFPTAPGVKATIKEKKAAEVVAGLDAKEVGDTQLEAETTFPPELPAGVFEFVVITPDGAASGGAVRLREAGQFVVEKEPDNGFHEAQPIEVGSVIIGGIKEDKDVDVFRFTGRAGHQLNAEVSAQQRGSLLDSALTLFNAAGQLLATNDDVAPSRDARIAIELPADGIYFLCVSDVHDRGGGWHQYELRVEGAAK